MAASTFHMRMKLLCAIGGASGAEWASMADATSVWAFRKYAPQHTTYIRESALHATASVRGKEASPRVAFPIRLQPYGISRFSCQADCRIWCSRLEKLEMQFGTLQVECTIIDFGVAMASYRLNIWSGVPKVYPQRTTNIKESQLHSTASVRGKEASP